VEAAGIETCVALAETQQFQILGFTAGGVRVECSDEGMQRHAAVPVTPVHGRWGGLPWRYDLRCPGVRHVRGSRAAEGGPRLRWLDEKLSQHAFVVLLFYRGFW